MRTNSGGWRENTSPDSTSCRSEIRVVSGKEGRRNARDGKRKEREELWRDGG